MKMRHVIRPAFWTGLPRFACKCSCLTREIYFKEENKLDDGLSSLIPHWLTYPLNRNNSWADINREFERTSLSYEASLGKDPTASQPLF